MATTPKHQPKPAVPQDEAVNEGPPKFRKLHQHEEEALVAAALQALSENREARSIDSQGRAWVFAPDAGDGVTGLRITVSYRDQQLGTNHVPSGQLQCEAGPQLLATVVAILGGAT